MEDLYKCHKFPWSVYSLFQFLSQWNVSTKIWCNTNKGANMRTVWSHQMWCRRKCTGSLRLTELRLWNWHCWHLYGMQRASISTGIRALLGISVSLRTLWAWYVASVVCAIHSGLALGLCFVLILFQLNNKTAFTFLTKTQFVYLYEHLTCLHVPKICLK